MEATMIRMAKRTDVTTRVTSTIFNSKGEYKRRDSDDLTVFLVE
jgi:hypothetical protein